MIQAIGLFIVNHIPLAVLEITVHNGWTVYDILEKIFC